jgi:PAS domain S-box-containing protein
LAGRVNLSGRTKAVVGIAGAGGLIALAAAVASVLRGPAPDANQLWVFAALSALMIATWLRPLVMYRDGHSEALNLDEGFFILIALLLPLSGGILVFAVATAVAQGIQRRPVVKSIFNWGQVVSAVGLGLLVARLLAPPTNSITGAELLAAAVGAVVFSLVNSAATATILATLGTPLRRALDGVGIRLCLVGSGVAVAMVSALAISAYRWSLPVALLPLLILRQVLAGHFQARHDRARMLGLFDAALEANGALGEGDVVGSILQSARTLLRCPDAAVRSVAEGPSELGATMLVNGERCWLVVSGRSRTEPFDAADKVLLEALAAVGAGALTNGHNYREARFQRERLSAITTSLGEGVCALDEDSQVTFMNPAAARMLGWDGQPGTAESRQAPEFLLAPARQVMETGETVRGDDAEFRRHDGSALPVAFTASAILADDRMAGAVIVFRDISERREVENAIRVARDQAIEASRLKSQFLANMSHEIRTPMNGVLGLSNLLLETEVDAAQHQYLVAIRDSGENLMVILNDILDFSKIEAGKLDLEEVDFDLRASLASVTNGMSVAAHDKELGLQLDVDPALPKIVRADPVRLRQVLTNLVGNAIKFTRVGGVTVNVRAPEPGRVRISVTDTGIGIDPSARATVLDAFGQADSSTTRRYGGTGLGLAICCQLVGMMGGVLDFSSQPGVGSVFWFDVPFAEALSSSAGDPETGIVETGTAETAETETAPPETRTGQTRTAEVRPEWAATPLPDSPRVLIADDNAVNQLVVSLRLEKLGYQVDVVKTGMEAMLAVQRTGYAAVLMDCRMPVMDGYEATRQIRALAGPAGATPIIAMTSSAMVGDREDCLQAGMDDYLSKPLDAGLLATAVARAVQGQTRRGVTTGSETVDGPSRLLQTTQ